MKLFSYLFNKKGIPQDSASKDDSNPIISGTFELANNFLQKNDIQGLEKTVSDFFVNGEYEIGCKLVSDFFSINSNTKTLGWDYKDGIGEKNLFAVKHIMNSNFLTDSMNLSKEKNLVLRGIIATHLILEVQGISSEAIEEKILSILPDLDCPLIREYFAKRGQGRWSHFDYEDFSDRAFLFYHMVWQEAYSTYDFLRHTTNSEMENRTGIMVIGGDIKCSICKGEQTYFTWDKLERVPKLPLYPGCICWYSLGNRK